MNAILENKNRIYWNKLTDEYHILTKISTDDFHFGPIVPGDKDLGLLPKKLAGLKCFEIACGGGENSIFLAKNDAICSAMDISENQLAYAKKLANKNNVSIDFTHFDMDNLEKYPLDLFDLVHSSYGLPFSHNPKKLLEKVFQMLKPGAVFLFSVGHPLFYGDFIEVSDTEKEAVVIEDYFTPTADIRFSTNGQEEIRSISYPISFYCESLFNTGFLIKRIVEPPSGKIKNDIPYYSDDWNSYFETMKKIPSIVIYLAIKP